ncbi:MAG TPA: DinB family protein [Tepidisphaeraceae bacterium]|jgi:hypothetical protein|nr:DinB family protein [Tepidisphaeraceae bacterium]
MPNSLVNLLDRAFNKRSWHGANLMGTIRGVQVRQAKKRVSGRKTIWEQLLHAAYWKNVVIRKLSGQGAMERKGSNWLKMPRPGNEKQWKDDLTMLRELHRKLRGIVAEMSAKMSQKDTWLIQGAAFHDIYHAGQIKLLRRLMK